MVFTALGQFREMVKSPQIMGMNKQKSLYSHFTFKLVSFKPRVLPVLGHLGIRAFWGIMDANFTKQGQKYLEGRYKSSTLYFKSNKFQIKCKGHQRV